MIAIQKFIIYFILILLAVYIALGLAVFFKTICIYHFWLWIQFYNKIYTANVIKLNIWKAEHI